MKLPCLLLSSLILLTACQTTPKTPEPELAPSASVEITHFESLNAAWTRLLPQIEEWNTQYSLLKVSANWVDLNGLSYDWQFTLRSPEEPQDFVIDSSGKERRIFQNETLLPIQRPKSSAHLIQRALQNGWDEKQITHLSYTQTGWVIKGRWSDLTLPLFEE